MGVVPIVNENDTISVSVCPVLSIDPLGLGVFKDLTGLPNFQEIKFGDNDTLSAITSSMVHADFLFLLTDVDGLYSSNPRKDPDAKFLEVVSSVAEARSGGKEPAQTLPFVISPLRPIIHSSWRWCFVLEPIHSLSSTASFYNLANQKNPSNCPTNL